MEEAGGFTSTLGIHGCRDAREEVQTALATEPSTPSGVLSTLGGVPSTPGVVPSGPVVVLTTLGWVLNAPIAEPRGLAVVRTTLILVSSTPGAVPSTPRGVLSTIAVVPSTTARVPSTLGAVPTTPAEQETASMLIEFASPPSDITEFMDAFHDGEEVWFYRLDDIIGGIGS
jgi:hypothetical protein